MSSYSFLAIAMSTGKLWGFGRRNQCKTCFIIPAEDLEVGVGDKATQGCTQPLRAVVTQGSKQSGWDSDVPMAFPDIHAVLLCVPMAQDRGFPTSWAATPG